MCGKRAVLHKPISLPFSQQVQRVAEFFFYSKRLLKVLNKSISLPFSKNKVLNNTVLTHEFMPIFHAADYEYQLYLAIRVGVCAWRSFKVKQSATFKPVEKGAGL
jgi:hypothetical protein